MSFFEFMGMMITKDLMEKEEKEREMGRMSPLFSENLEEENNYYDDDDDDMWD